MRAVPLSRAGEVTSLSSAKKRGARRARGASATVSGASAIPVQNPRGRDDRTDSMSGAGISDPTGSASIANRLLTVAVPPSHRSARRLPRWAREHRTDSPQRAPRADAPSRPSGCLASLAAAVLTTTMLGSVFGRERSVQLRSDPDQSTSSRSSILAKWRILQVASRAGRLRAIEAMAKSMSSIGVPRC